MPEPARVAIVAARNEADRVGATLDALGRILPGARLIVADDASTDATRERAMAHGAWLISRRKPHGKGGNVTAASEAAIGEFPGKAVVLLCDGDLGDSAGELLPLVHAVERGECEIAVARFAETEFGGFGFVSRYARRTVERLSGLRIQASISGQRAMRVATLRELLPFAGGWGLELGMTIDAARAGLRIAEIELPVADRPTPRTPAGFLHRARQLWDCRAAARSRR